MREEVDRLERALDDKATLAETLQEQGDATSRRFRELISDLMDELPEDSALLDPLLEEVTRYWPPNMVNQRVAKIGKRGVLSDIARYDTKTSVDMVQMLTYLVDVEPIARNALHRRLRVKLSVGKNAEECMAYEVDEQYLRTCGFSNRMVAEIAMKVARELQLYWREKVIGGR